MKTLLREKLDHELILQIRKLCAHTTQQRMDFAKLRTLFWEIFGVLLNICLDEKSISERANLISFHALNFNARRLGDKIIFFLHHHHCRAVSKNLIT